MPAAAPTVRVLLVGDLMLGRGVGDLVIQAPETIFEQIRPVIVDADLAVGNLESPLTRRTHVLGPNALEALPEAASLLAGAGFDVLSVANNHAGDAGPETVSDTLAALRAADLAPVGGGTAAEAWAPLVVEREGVRIAFLAFDTTGAGPSADGGVGIAVWDPTRAEHAVAQARERADVVVVGLHGGVEYLPRPDPVLADVVDRVSSWGADVVWASGAHVPYPVTVSSTRFGRPSVQAPGLGNALFDRGLQGTETGAVLEVLVGHAGVVAYRTGHVESVLRSRFAGWQPPVGDAVSVDGEWWAPTLPFVAGEHTPADGVAPPFGDAVVVAASRGDLTGDGVADVVTVYRRPVRDRPLHRAFPGIEFADEAGNSAHLAVLDGADGRLLWGAGTLVRPVADVAVCDASLALGFGALADPDVHRVTSAGAWFWRGDGFSTLPVLPGTARLGCVDIDGDGRTEPILSGRTAGSDSGG
jgi:poly-gamma-glutamate capsule biosynthesis protein CapA/YwtB (metallophosphatase superfamily)